MFKFYKGVKDYVPLLDSCTVLGQVAFESPPRSDVDVHKGLSRQREQYKQKFCLELQGTVRGPGSTECVQHALGKKKKMRYMGKRVYFYLDTKEH